MKLTINKTPVDATGLRTLAELLERENLNAPGMAVALGTRVVPRKAWPDTLLEENMSITVIGAVCGG